MKKDVSHSSFYTCYYCSSPSENANTLPPLVTDDLTSKNTSQQVSLSPPQLTICYSFSLLSFFSIHWFSECIFVKSEEGVYSYTAPGGTTAVCGLYVIAEPDHVVEIEFENYFVSSCDLGSLVSVINGWELNGQFFPGMWVTSLCMHHK